MFSWLVKDQPGALDKIVAVSGDLTLPGLGISSHDLNLLIEDVSIVINSAASVRFDDDLKDALETNVKGPRQLLALSQKMKKLEVSEYQLDFGNDSRIRISQPSRLLSTYQRHLIACITKLWVK